MKKLLTLMMSLLVVSAMFGQSRTEFITVPGKALTSAAVRCDVELPAYSQPANGGNSLHSTDNFNLGTNLGLAEDFNIPVLTSHGLQVISSVQVAGVSRGGVEGNAFRVEVWSDAAGAPGVMMTQNNMDGIAAGGAIEFEPPSSWNVVQNNTNYWLSIVGDAGFTTGRWFWTFTSRGDNQGEEYSTYYNGVGFGGVACDQWTSASDCAVLNGFGGFGLNFRFNLCQNASLDLGGTPVPTMTQWGLFLFGLIILTLGVVSIYNFSRRRVAE